MDRHHLSGDLRPRKGLLDEASAAPAHFGDFVVGHADQMVQHPGDGFGVGLNLYGCIGGESFGQVALRCYKNWFGIGPGF